MTSKTQKTIGMIVLILGLFLLVVGLILVLNSKSKPIQTEQKTSLEEIAQKQEHSKHVIDSLIEVAVADGIYTPNEQKVLKGKIEEMGLNYDDFSSKIEELLKQQPKKETEIVDENKKKGNDFEKYTIKKFDLTYFTILEWAGDKYVEGRYAKTTIQPDLKMRYKHKEIEKVFAVECKYRSEYYNNGIEWAKETQLQNYQNYAKEHSIPVFVVIGVGGTASEPDELFSIPLREITSCILSKSFLEKYRKVNFKEHNFFFNPKEETLR